MSIRQIQAVLGKQPTHWVGDGFPVRTIFSTQNLGKRISPFILMDYAGPVEFAPSEEPRGVDEHPHRGFETVTIVYQGELEHRDSAGNSGRIGPGDVQWMTAASGVVHEEKHAAGFAAKGGILHMVQLWVNLPAAHKMSPPAYQTLLNEQIPAVPIAGGAGGRVRVIAGEYQGTKGPARTFTPVGLWDVRLNTGRRIDLTVPGGCTAAILVLKGKVRINTAQVIDESEFVMFERDGDTVIVEAQEDAVLLVLSGEPIDEPVVAYGPFVMNTTDEISRAIEDYQTGKMGRILFSKQPSA